MKILICSLQVSSEGAKGHFIPAIEIALQAKRSGHDLSLLPLPSRLGDEDVKLCKELDINLIETPKLPNGVIKNKNELAQLARDNSKTHLAFKSFLVDPLEFQREAFEKIVELEKPDIIINDLLLYLPTITSNKLKIKNYGYCAGFKLLADNSLTSRYKEYSDLLSPDIAAFLERTSSNLNLKNLECLTEGGNYVFFPAGLNILNEEENIRCIGSLPNSLDLKKTELTGDTRPYAVLSFGSVLDPFDFPETTENIIKLCEEEKLHLYISTKKKISSPNITAMPYLPLSHLLKNAHLYFHHGGANSFNEATRLGVPQILVPLTTDQPIQANILNKLGHGFSLDKENITYQELKEIVKEFKDNDSEVNKRRIEMEEIFNGSNGAVSLIQEVERDFYNDNIYAETTSYEKIYFPKTVIDVQNIVKEANVLRQKVYPISSAKSYGMGTKLKGDSDCSYIDLKYLKKISNYNERSGTIEVESGVTQKELSIYLKSLVSKYTVNVTGSSEDSSIVANITDRGIGHFREREKDIISLKVVTGNANVIETGGGVYENSQVINLYSSGLGPNLSSIFLQSNFGIVTSAVIKLVPKRDTLIVNMTIEDEELLPDFIEKVSELIRRGILTESLHISNRYRKESVLAPLKAKHNEISIEQARDELNIVGEYFATTSIRTDFRIIESYQTVIEEELRNLCLINFTSKKSFENKNSEFLRGVFNHSFGIPCDDAILSLGYEFNRIVNPKKLEREGIGTFFLVPLIPFEGKMVDKVISIVNEVFSKYRFVPYITLNSISNSCFEGVINLNFDNSNDERVESAKTAMLEAFNELNLRGFSPQRMSVFQKGSFSQVKPSHKDAIGKLKEMFDPNNVIIGAKYEF